MLPGGQWLALSAVLTLPSN